MNKIELKPEILLTHLTGQCYFIAVTTHFVGVQGSFLPVANLSPPVLASEAIFVYSLHGSVMAGLTRHDGAVYHAKWPVFRYENNCIFFIVHFAFPERGRRWLSFKLCLLKAPYRSLAYKFAFLLLRLDIGRQVKTKRLARKNEPS